MFNIKLYRVECPVCKRRRPLSEMEVSALASLGKYHCYQFCSETCKRVANPDQVKKVDDSNLAGKE